MLYPQNGDRIVALYFVTSFHRIYTDCIKAKYAAEICGNTVQNCLKPTTPSRSTGVRTHGWCHYVGNQMVDVTKPNERGNRNTSNVKIAVENANLCVKNMRYAHFAEICENAAISEICAAIAYLHKLTCLCNFLSCLCQLVFVAML